MVDESDNPKYSRRRFLTLSGAGLVAGVGGCRSLQLRPAGPVTRDIPVVSDELARLLAPLDLREISWEENRRQRSCIIPFAMVHQALQAAGVQNTDRINFDLLLEYLKHPRVDTIIPVLENLSDITGFQPKRLMEDLKTRFGRAMLRAGVKVEFHPVLQQAGGQTFSHVPQDLLEKIGEAAAAWRISPVGMAFIENPTRYHNADDHIARHILNGEQQRDR